jgi:hypothetical protein
MNTVHIFACSSWQPRIFRSHHIISQTIFCVKMAVFWVEVPCKTTLRYNPEDSHLRTHRCKNLKSYLFFVWSIYIINKCWLVGDHFLLTDFGPCGIIFMNVCAITVAMVMLLRNFGPCEIIFITIWSFVRGLLCTCTSTQRSKTCLRVNASQLS